MKRIIHSSLKEGSRVKVVSNHLWMPDRYGTIKRLEARRGNCLVVKFDVDELGVWHDEDGDPVLRLGEDDLILIEQGRLAA